MEKPNESPSDATQNLRLEIERLNDSQFMRMHNSVLHLLSIQLLKGLALGFGTVLGATLLVSVAVVFLTKIDFIPIIGDWAMQIAEQMKQPR